MDSLGLPTHRQPERHLLLADALPAFAAEFQRLLAEAGEPELAAQVPSLSILGRCRCGDGFCATFYTEPKPDGAYGPGHRNVVLAPEEGTIILDVVAGEIACVEVLDRKDVRQKLDRKPRRDSLGPTISIVPSLRLLAIPYRRTGTRSGSSSLDSAMPRC